jgi:hypothetical protein
MTGRCRFEQMRTGRLKHLVKIQVCDRAFLLAHYILELG